MALYFKISKMQLSDISFRFKTKAGSKIMRFWGGGQDDYAFSNLKCAG